MKYTSVTEGEFVCRNNRFTAEVPLILLMQVVVLFYVMNMGM